ncbi:unnamed protein product, partial [Soboliphyme baturini]
MRWKPHCHDVHQKICSNTSDIINLACPNILHFQFRAFLDSEIRVFDAHLKQVTWMDEKSRAAAILKADNIQYNVGYPRWILNDTKLDRFYEPLSVKSTEDIFDCMLNLYAFAADKNFERMAQKPVRDDFQMTVATVNAWYSPEYNSITIPASIMNAPFFRVDYPAAKNFGAMGSIIGHELIHGYDNQGMKYNYNGTRETWMTDESKAGFDNMSDCIVEQYNKTCYPYMSMCVNGNQTLGENIADIGGIKVAFYAYQKYVSEHGKEPRLPGLEDFSMEKIFFLSFAQLWCEKQSITSLYLQIIQDEHSPAKVRVINTLRNFNEFSKTFGCKPGAAMNP